ncbi:hypothetical protein [Exiguobacterium sp. s133]|uniref:hypothetical protein n=1 Tax=Exiguobacterium sp. s133 TaxID=2751213 RepID=UPI001BE7394B|nr:hypothetical protein [Exiguobacterium sp. s133]
MAAKSARVVVLNETQETKSGIRGGWTLCLQWCIYTYDDGTNQHGYRFIWRRPDGKLQAARGQARIPNLEIAMRLMQQAKDAGWGDLSNNSLKDDNR